MHTRQETQLTITLQRLARGARFVRLNDVRFAVVRDITSGDLAGSTWTHEITRTTAKALIKRGFSPVLHNWQTPRP